MQAALLTQVVVANYMEKYMGLGFAMFPMFALGLFGIAVVLTWLYNTSRGSILMIALWHTLIDLLLANSATDGIVQAVMTALIIAWAIAIVLVFKPANLSPEPRQVL